MQKKQKDAFGIKVNNVIVNVKMSDGLNHCIVFNNIDDTTTIEMIKSYPENPFDSNIIKANIKFGYLPGSMIIH